MLSALELYAERGFEVTTVLEVAERAGVTERTFFRHFADKREVLFEGSSDLQEAVIAAIAASPAAMGSIDVVASAMQHAASLLADRSYAQRRATVIAANPSLQERELLKLATLSGAVAEALRRRGATDLAASLTADTGVTMFKIGFELWIGDDSTGDFPQCIRTAAQQLRGLISDG